MFKYCLLVEKKWDVKQKVGGGCNKDRESWKEAGQEEHGGEQRGREGSQEPCKREQRKRKPWFTEAEPHNCTERQQGAREEPQAKRQDGSWC